MREVRERVYKHTTSIVSAEDSRTLYPGSSQQNGWQYCIYRLVKIYPEYYGYFRGNFPQFTVLCLRLLFIDRKYDSIFEVVQQNFSEQFY